MKEQIKKCLKTGTWLCLLFSILGQTADAQWTSQTIVLSPGWNAVFIEVQPEPNDIATVLNGVPVESVWAWNQRFAPTQIIDATDLDAIGMVPEQPEWLVYIPLADPQNPAPPGSITNLYTIRGGHAYLIKFNGNEPVTWTIHGKAIVPSSDWISDAYNLTGFYVDQVGAPTFANYFTASAAHSAGTPPGNKSRYYRLAANGKWQAVSADTPIERGKAYWIWCQGASNYAGPLRIITEHYTGLDFGDVLPEQRISLKNETNTSITANINTIPSEPPAGDASAPAPVNLFYWDCANMGWADLTGSVSVTVQPGSDSVLRLGVRRKDMPPLADSQYQSIISVSNGLGQRLLLPVTSSGLMSSSQKGLWAGTVSVNAVSYPAGEADHETPQPTASEFEMRIIIHVDDAGNARLLQQAAVFWEKGTLNPEGMVASPGRYVVFSDEALMPDLDSSTNYSGAALRDGMQVARRISTSAYIMPLVEDGSGSPVKQAGQYVRQTACTMSGNGAFGVSDSIFNTTLKVFADDPLNPYKHRFHPDHDNLTGQANDIQQPDGRESYTVTRQIQLTFQENNPEGATLLSWGDNTLGGIYEETIQGLYTRRLPDNQLISNLRVKGTFLIKRLVDEGVLNPGG